MSTTLADHVAAFLSDMARVARLRPHTLRAYRYELTAAAAALTAPLDQLTLTALEQWVSRGAVSTATVARRTATLSRFFTWALRHQLCTTHPLAPREATHTRRRLPRPIPAGDERTAIDTAITTAPPPYRQILILLRETGMRAGEALTLTLSDVTLAPGREGIRVRDPKNRTERIVVLGPTATPKALRMLRAHVGTLRGQPPHAPLFRSLRGTWVSYDALHYQWGQVCATAGRVDAQGKPRYTLHQLRHTRGSELVEHGHRMEIVQRVLGHRDPRSTQGYAALHDDQVRAALEQEGRH
jgi:integrase/recombinase XerD